MPVVTENPTCWTWNIDNNARKYFADELSAGRLHQGWGYDDKLDLRLMKKKLEAHKALDPMEQEAWNRCWYMLEAIKPGDLVVVKNLPERETFTIVRVTGDYAYLSASSTARDYRHVLPVEKVGVFHKNARHVPAPLASALGRQRHPIRRNYLYHGAVSNLAALNVPDDEKIKPQQFREKLSRIRNKLVQALRGALKDNLTPTETERLVGALLMREGMDVAWTAGAGEKGADLRCDAPVGLGITHRLAVQVKMHWEADDDTTGVGQLKTAIGAHNAKAGILVTVADKLGSNLENAIQEAQKEHDIQVLYGDDLFGRLLELIAEPSPELPE